MTRRKYVWLTGFALLPIVAVSLATITPRLIWNASVSVPVGLYALRPAGRLAVGDLVAVTPPPALARFLAERHYLPLDTPLMKRVAALPGQQVCRIRRTITVDGKVLGSALDRDRRGRALPDWQGCRRVAHKAVFLMNWSVRDSLDGRYFGPLPAATIIGRATPIYTDEADNGRFVRPAAAR